MEKISSRKHVSTGVLFAIRKIKLSQKLHATRYLSIELNLSWLSATTGVVPYLQSWTKLLRKCHILRAFFLTSSLYRVLPSPLPLEAMLLCVLKQPWSLDICRKQHWPGGRGIWYRKSVVVEIVLLRSIVCMEGYKFLSSFVRDCSCCWVDKE